ncbi:MAG: response regulator [Opitutaceae bacterium]|nr:response regulator [Opitutaceae bacterium]
MRFYHSHLLARAGFKCTVATNGHEALDSLKAQPVDLLVVDIVMPEMTGEELIRNLRATPTLAQLPVLVISSESIGDRIRRERTGTSGPVGFVRKPLLPAAILAEVEDLLR